ncbi:MCE family protein [Mycolicibacterium sp.]|uniref:MCE family protein n=1 Tax=Mycolicibacterium sp. TaxID=2320850 RepID=UPI003D0EDA8D
MTGLRITRTVLAVVLVAVIAGAGYLLVRSVGVTERVEVTAYFERTTGVFAGDEVRIRGVSVGKIERIDPEPTRVKVTFWFDARYPVPADVKAVIISPTLVTARAIQLTPPYRGGPTLQDGAVIGEQRTAVPVEWDEVRTQLQRLATTLEPTEPGGVSTMGALVHTTAENLRGQGAAIRTSILHLSQAISALGDHSGDIFTSVKNLSILVSALQDSTDLLRRLNVNLASVSGVLADDPGDVAGAIADLDDVVGEVTEFVAENRESLGTTSDNLAAVSTAMTESLDDIKQALHILPTVAANAANLYQPAQGTLSGIAAVNNFSDPITFLCGAIQAASRMGAEESAKLCVQYLAPIVKNRQYNFPPLGFNPIVGASARPNEITYSEEWMRPDYVPPQPAPTEGPVGAPLAAETAATTDPADGLPGMMIHPAAGS